MFLIYVPMDHCKLYTTVPNIYIFIKSSKGNSKIIYPSLVLVQPRKTRPCLTERLLMGHKESNQTNKQVIQRTALVTSKI